MARIEFQGSMHEIEDELLMKLLSSTKAKLVHLKLLEKSMFPKKDAELLKWLEAVCYTHKIY